MNKKTIQDAIRLRNAMRQVCRTDLLKFANEVLGYQDVSRAVHGPIIDALPKLQGGVDKEVAPGYWKYYPAKEIWQMSGLREFLFMYARGHLKTTLISQAFLIQCIINWPDIRILLSCATGDQIEKVMRAVKGVFQYNEYFRTLFPDFCPPKEKANDFGSKDQFITPARKLTRGEPTVFSVTVGKTIAGYHPDIIFHSDLVDKENVKTPGGINDVNDHFKYMEPLLERYSARDGYPASRGFTIVEGTPYDFGDLHNTLMKSEFCGHCSASKDDHTPRHKCKNFENGWVKVIRPAQENYPNGPILWPERFPPEELERIRQKMGDWLFSAQYLMKCVPSGDGLCDPKDVVFMPAEIVKRLTPTLRLHCTIDLAGMETTRGGDDTVLNVSGFDKDGRLYVIELHAGQFSPEEVIALIFSIYRRYPQMVDFKIEKDAHARVLLPFLQREMSKRGRYPIFVPIKRDTHTTKQHRIRGLRPWFTEKIIRFSDDIPLHIKNKLLDQITQFPSQSSGVHDDILDTLADQMQNGEGTVNIDVIADAPDMKFAGFNAPRPPDKFLGFSEAGTAQWLFGNDPEAAGARGMTGFLD